MREERIHCRSTPPRRSTLERASLKTAWALSGRPADIRQEALSTISEISRWRLGELVARLRSMSRIARSAAASQQRLISRSEDWGCQVVETLMMIWYPLVSM